MSEAKVKIGAQELTIDASNLEDMAKDLKEGKQFASRWVVKDGKIEKAGSIRRFANHCLYDGVVRVDVLHITCLVGGAAYRDSMAELPVIGKIMS